MPGRFLLVSGRIGHGGEMGYENDWNEELVAVRELVRRFPDERGAFSCPAGTRCVNPCLSLIPTAWRGLPAFLEGEREREARRPERKDGMFLVWRDPETFDVRVKDAVEDDLLALKLVVEEIGVREAARLGNTTCRQILAVLAHGVRLGILLSPGSGITRKPDRFPETPVSKDFRQCRVFSLQWHVTQACELHCRHCYDRSDRRRLSLAESERVLDDLLAFTEAMQVRGHVTFTGGNPLLYPGFPELYKAAADRGFSTAILGNPTTKEVLDTFVSIQKPTHYQISLEGLEKTNDFIRGKGHFKRSIDFLEILKEKGVTSMVMLTLNRDNMDEVLPLGEFLNGKTGSFTFNRLAMVGEGANLGLPDKEAYNAFLQAYLEARKTNPVLSLKDGLLETMVEDQGEVHFGGCAGFGCGAAFNFVSLLPDGEVHACRKFPSKIGNILEASLREIYEGKEAALYRKGSDGCVGCDLFSVCRGCPAVVHGMGLDWTQTRDPFCNYVKAPK